MSNGVSMASVDLIVGDITFIDHPIQRIDLPLFGAFRMPERRIPAGSLGKSGHHGTLCKIQIPHGLAEIIFSRRNHPVCAVPEVNLVQIKKKHFRLGKCLFDPISQNRLLDLPRIAPFRRQQKRFGHLLGNGASSLDDAPRLDIFEKGPDNTENIHAFMLVKSRILGGYERFDEQLRHLGQRA